MPRPLVPTILRSIFTGGLLAATSCTPAPAPGRAGTALLPLATCGDAIDFVRQVALARMDAQIDQQLATFDRGEGCSYGLEGDAAHGGPTPGGVSPPAAAPSNPTDRAATSSGTNNQVASVDEADFVKNDGKYVYLAQNGVLRIVDGWPAASAHQVSKTPLDGTPRKLFVDGDRALVYVSVPDPRRRPDPANPGGVASYGTAQACTYGYDCDLTGDGTSTKLEVFDVRDRAHPQKVREVFLSGSLIAARRVGHATHTVVSDDLVLFPELGSSVGVDLCGYQSGSSYSPTPVQPPPAAVAKAHAAYEALRAKNRAIILGKDLSGVLPRVADSAGGAAALGDPAALCRGLYRAQLLDGASFTTLVSMDLTDAVAPTTATIVSSPGAVYASDRALYVAVPSERSYGGPWYAGYEAEPQASSIYEFAISDHVADTRYVGSGLIKGRVLNQFAMDEKDGLLRVASTTGHVPDPSVESQLTVLAPDEGSGDLSQVGIVEHLGPKEDIRAVRFDGDQAFVVTFKKTDPLFVVDLRDPSAPRVTGELKIPGFSTYIHKLDDTHLLSIGYDANDHDSFAFFDGVLLQIFDIADPADPKLVQRYKIGTRGSSSEALTDHLAFNYFAPLKMLAVPMTVCEGGGDGAFGSTMTFSGLMLFDVDAQAGIAEHGRVAYPLPANTQFASDASCSHWWTDAGSDVKRSIFMERFVYAISDERLKVQSVDALGSDLQSLDLERSISP